MFKISQFAIILYQFKLYQSALYINLNLSEVANLPYQQFTLHVKILRGHFVHPLSKNLVILLAFLETPMLMFKTVKF